MFTYITILRSLARFYPRYIINLHEEAEVETSEPRWAFSPRAEDVIRQKHKHAASHLEDQFKLI